MPHIKANGIELFYELRGPADAPVIVFSHSLGASNEMWDAQMAEFAGRYRCLRYDTRGHGQSEVVNRLANIDDLADDLAGLMDALAIRKAHIVGLSLGGMTAQAFALRHSDRLDRLVLISTAAKLDPNAYRDRAATALSQGYESFVDEVLSPRWFTRGFATRFPETIAAYRRRFVATDPAGYAAACEVIATLDLAERIHGITAPTLIMVGAADIPTPVSCSEDLRNRIPDAEMVIIPRLAHLLVAERPDLVNPYIAMFIGRSRTIKD